MSARSSAKWSCQWCFCHSRIRPLIRKFPLRTVSRVNVGVLQAGTGRNIIPNTAHLKVETRGETTAVNQYMYERAVQIVHSAADMYGVEARITLMGEAQNCAPSETLLAFIRQQAKSVREIHTVTGSKKSGGSEDATYMMTRVKKQGGLVAYIVFGTTLSAGHHNERFDIVQRQGQQSLSLLEKLALITIGYGETSLAAEENARLALHHAQNYGDFIPYQTVNNLYPQTREWLQISQSSATIEEDKNLQN